MIKILIKRSDGNGDDEDDNGDNDNNYEEHIKTLSLDIPDFIIELWTEHRLFII